MSLIQGDIAIAYIPAVPWKGIKHWSTGVNQESIKLLSNLKQSDLTLIIYSSSYALVIITLNAYLMLKIRGLDVMRRNRGK